MQTIVNRHEALRTTASPDGQAQIVTTPVKLEVPLLDFSADSDPSPQQKLANWFADESKNGFDMVNGPTFRATVMKLSDNEHILTWTGHHSLVDGMAMGVIAEEFCQLYSAKSMGGSAELPSPTQFSAYVAWQSDYLNSQVLQRHEQHWLSQFANDIPTLDLPTDNPRPAVRTYSGSKLSRTLHADLSKALVKVSRKNKQTLFMTMLSAYSALLHTWSKQDAIIIGVPAGGRSTMPNSQSLVGYSARQLPIISRLQDGATFAEFSQSIKQVLLSAYSNQDYPFARLLDQLNLQRDPSRPMLLSAIFNLDKLPKVRLPGLEIELVVPPISFVEYEIEVNVSQIESQLTIEMIYNTDLFSAETIQQRFDLFEKLLHAISAEATDQPLAQLCSELGTGVQKAAKKAARAQFKKLRKSKFKKTGA